MIKSVVCCDFCNEEHKIVNERILLMKGWTILWSLSKTRHACPSHGDLFFVPKNKEEND